MNQDTILFRITVNLENTSEELLFHGYDQPELICEEFAMRNKLSTEHFEKLIGVVNACIADLVDTTSEKDSEIVSKENSSSPEKNIPQRRLLKQSLQVYKKDCSKVANPSIKLLESATSKHKRFQLLTNLCSTKKEIYSFHPEISKK